MIHRAVMLALLLAAALPARPGATAEARIAVASNFQNTARALLRAFGQSGGQHILLSFGSTGRHFAQIMHGAPYDAFLAAGSIRPRKLEASGRIVPGSRFTYAIGRLVLYSPLPGFVDREGEILKSVRFERLAIANPRLAPYGRAAMQTLGKLGLWRTLAPRLVRGENIGQAFQFVKSGAARLGFVAASQIVRPGASAPGSLWRVPQSLHDPINQQAVLLRPAPAARAFLAFLRSARGRAIIAAHGYALPE